MATSSWIVCELIRARPSRLFGFVPVACKAGLIARSRLALAHVRQLEAQKFQRKRGVETGDGQSQRVVQRMLGPADRRGAAGGERARRVERGIEYLGVGYGHGNEADSFGLGARQGLVRQQVVSRLRETAEQRRRDVCVVAR